MIVFAVISLYLLTRDVILTLSSRRVEELTVVIRAIHKNLSNCPGGGA